MREAHAAELAAAREAMSAELAAAREAHVVELAAREGKAAAASQAQQQEQAHGLASLRAQLDAARPAPFFLFSDQHASWSLQGALLTATGLTLSQQ